MVILIAAAALVFARALQQLNVTGGHYLAAAGTSYLIALTEVTVILMAVQTGWSSIPWIGTGGAIGVTSAMLMHKHTIGRKNG